MPNYPLPPEEVERVKLSAGYVPSLSKEEEAEVETLRIGEHKDLSEPEDFYLYYANRLPIVVVPRPPNA